MSRRRRFIAGGARRRRPRRRHGGRGSRRGQTDGQTVVDRSELAQGHRHRSRRGDHRGPGRVRPARARAALRPPGAKGRRRSPRSPVRSTSPMSRSARSTAPAGRSPPARSRAPSACTTSSPTGRSSKCSTSPATRSRDPDPVDQDNFPEESNPYGLTVMDNGDALVADAAANDVIRVTPDGVATTVARFDLESIATDHLDPDDFPGLPPELDCRGRAHVGHRSAPTVRSTSAS